MSETPIPSKNPVFRADPKLCVACGKCVADCPMAVLEIKDGRATGKPHFAEACFDCQHCLAVCPTGAASVGGRDPAASQPIGEWDYAALDNLIRGRRSVRLFDSEPVDRKVLLELIDSACHAPAAVNARDRLYTLVHDPAVLADFRDRLCRALVDRAGELAEEYGWLVKSAEKWFEKGRDVIFRGAPHMLVVTAGPLASVPKADCLISLSGFELLAQARGLGTVWVGMVQMALEQIPEAREWLGIPADHTLGYAMLVGKPAVRYARTVQHKPEHLHVVEGIVG